jgi:hypothetical protein
MKEGKELKRPPKEKPLKKPKKYVNVSIHKGNVQVDENVSIYESSEESDAIKDYLEKEDLHTTPY